MPETFFCSGKSVVLVTNVLKKYGFRQIETDKNKEAIDIFWYGATQKSQRLHGQLSFQKYTNHVEGSHKLHEKRHMQFNFMYHPLVWEYFPRTYDLKSVDQFFAFLEDFVLTRAITVYYNKSEESLDPIALETSKKILSRYLRNKPLLHLDEDWKALFGKKPLLPKQTRFTTVSKFHTLAYRELVNKSDSETVDSKQLDMDMRTKERLEFSFDRSYASHVAEELEEGKKRNIVCLLQRQMDSRGQLWILKKPSLDSGKGILGVFDCLQKLLSKAGDDWNCVVQKYLEKPLLVDRFSRLQVASKRGFKVDCRVFILVKKERNSPLSAFAYLRPYFRRCSFEFTLDQFDNKIHFTNRYFHKDSEYATVLSDVEFFDICQQVGTNLDLRLTWRQRTWPKILEIVRASLLSCESIHMKNRKGPTSFEILGTDFLLDEDMNPLFLEFNTSPDLSEDLNYLTDHLIEKMLYEALDVVFNRFTVKLPSVQVNEFSLSYGCMTMSNELREGFRVSNELDWLLFMRQDTAGGLEKLKLRKEFSFHHGLSTYLNTCRKKKQEQILRDFLYPLVRTVKKPIKVS